jgi:riboflavin kinase/FMN adenylyltransferase
MRVMSGHPSTWAPAAVPASVTIGVLDGVHLGHRALISRLRPELARTVLTFEPHPAEVLHPGTHPRLLTTIDERLRLLEGAGVDQVGILDLADIRELDAVRFVDEVLVDRLAMAHIVTGPDFRFGKDRGGDTGLLTGLGRGRGFEPEVIDMVGDAHGALSSSRIRTLIEEGRPAEAAQALGSAFTITGPVVGGDHRGRDLGYPTANVEPPARKVIPASGVYAGRARVGGGVHVAAINVGVRPTFGGGSLLVEAHLLDFDDDIYGDVIGVELCQYLRPEERFDDVDELVAQMALDVGQARALVSPSTG